MIGGTGQSMNRLLADLVRHGLLTIDHDTLVIDNLERLGRHVER